MSVFSFSRDNIATTPTLSAIAGGTTTAPGTLFFKIYNQNLAGNNFGSNSASISWTAGQQVRVQIPAAMRATGEFVERFVIAGSPSGNAGTWVQLAAIEAMDVNGAPLALPLTVDLSSDYDLSPVKAATTVAALPTTAKLGALTTIAALGGNVYRFEATTWPIPADGTGVIAVAGGRWVKHYGTFNSEPVSMAGAGGQRQLNSAVATPTKLIGYTGGSFSRSFYYSIYNDSATQDLVAGTNIGLTVLADGQPVTAQLSGKIEITLVGYVGVSGVLDTAPASGLPSLLYDYTNVGQVFLPANLPSGSQAVYRLRFNYSAVDFSQPVRSILVNLEPYATAPTQAPWAGLAGDSFIADSGGRFRFFPGLGLAGQVDDGQITINRYQSPVTPEQVVIGFAAATAGQLAIANATGQVSRQSGGYTPGPAEIVLATVGTVAGEHIKLNLGSVTLGAAGGINVTVVNPVDAGGRATVRANYSDSRIAGQSGFCRFNSLSIAIYLTNGATTYRTVVTPLNQASQVFTLNAPGSTVTAPVAASFGLFDPVGASATTTTGTIPAGTYQISIGYVYDGNQITSIAHNPAFSIYNGNAAGILGAHETTYNHGSFINLAQAQALVDAHTTTFNHANFATNAGVAATYLTQASAATLYKPLTTDDSVATGLRFALKLVQTGTPANGEVQFNNATLASVTQLLIAETGRDGTAIANLLGMLQQTTRVIIQSEQLEGVYSWFEISGAPTDSGAYRTVPVTFVTAPTGITTVANLGAAAAELTVNFYGAGGSSGVGSGLRFLYESAATIADTEGTFARNGTTFANATQVSFSVFENQINNADTVDVLQRLTTGAIFEVRKSATAFVRYRSTGTPVLDVSGVADCYNVPVASEAVGPDAIGDTDTVYLMILSDAPSSGEATGIQYTFNDADPPVIAGQIRTLQASLSVATSISISDTDSQTKDASNFLPRLTTNTIFQIAKDATNWVRFIATSTFSANSVSVTVQAFNGTIASGDTVFLSILSAPPAVTSGGGGLTWAEYTANASLAPGQGAIANSTNATSFTVPAGAVTDQPIGLMGSGTGICDLRGAVFTLPSGSSNSGIRRLSSSRYNTLTVKCYAPGNYGILSAGDLAGWELFNANASDTRLQNYITEVTAQGGTLTTQQQTAFSNWLTAIDAIDSNLWTWIKAFYPVMGGSSATHAINAKNPGTGALTIPGGATHSSNGITATATQLILVPNAFIAPLLLNTEFRYLCQWVGGYTTSLAERTISTTTNVYRLALRDSTSRMDTGCDYGSSTATGLTPAIPASYSGELSIRSRPGTASNVISEGFTNSTLRMTNAEAARVSLGSANIETGANFTLKGWIIISSPTALSNSQITALYNANLAFQTALGRN